MDNNIYLDCALELEDNIKPFIQQGQSGKKYLYFKIFKKKDGPDKYGKTHNLSIRYQANDGQYYTMFIGSATEKVIQARQTPPAPAPQGGYAPQGQYNQPRQYQQAPPQGYAPQAPAQPQYAPQNLPPQAPPPTMADAPFDGQTEDLPFS